MSQNTFPSVSCLILLSGPVAVGKTSVANSLTSHLGFERVRSGTFLQNKAKELGSQADRASLQALGDKLDDETDYRWIVDDVAAVAIRNNISQNSWLIDAVRKDKQVEHFRSTFGNVVLHIHLIADECSLKDRYEKRLASGGEYDGKIQYEEAILHPNEQASRSLKSCADLVVDVEGKSIEQVVGEIEIEISGTRS